MKLVKASMGILFAASLLIACGGKDKKEDKSPVGKLEGAWEIKRAEGINSLQNVGASYEFKGNKLTCRQQGFIIPGTTFITDSTFAFQIDGQEGKSMYKYHFNGDTLLVVPPNNVGQVFHMVKK
ncbi:MAG: hypothetical protein LH619_02325 [Chitinophagaceae bacterium]|nr:hypothetical protein [Chitinophagaceae bacterium]